MKKISTKELKQIIKEEITKLSENYPMYSSTRDADSYNNYEHRTPLNLKQGVDMRYVQSKMSELIAFLQDEASSKIINEWDVEKFGGDVELQHQLGFSVGHMIDKALTSPLVYKLS